MATEDFLIKEKVCIWNWGSDWKGQCGVDVNKYCEGDVRRTKVKYCYCPKCGNRVFVRVLNGEGNIT